MSEEMMSRRNFLGGVGAVLGLAAVPLLASAAAPATAAAVTTAPVALPWPYTHLDAETIGRRAYELYYLQGGCAEATWYPIIEALSADNPTTWGTLPKKMFGFGGGGVNAWGTLCGTCNGSAAIIKMVIQTAAGGTLIDNDFQFYSETPLPTNGIDKAVRAGWTPAAGVPAPIPNVPTSTAHSPLCHVSLTQWMATTGATDGSAQQRDRCAKACYDMAKHTVELLNDYFATPSVTDSAALDASYAGCVTNGCHSKAGMAEHGKMACDSCHDEPVDHATH
jgi:hypothetical protein